MTQGSAERESCERIVGEILAADLEVLAERGDEKHELSRLKAPSDRRIGLEPAPSTPGPSEGPGAELRARSEPSPARALASRTGRFSTEGCAGAQRETDGSGPDSPRTR